MKRRFNRTQRNYIIAGLCMILVIMGVGYAAFSSQLKISGTSNIDSTWDIEITGIETILPGDGVQNGYNISEPTYTPTSATFSAGFELPGSMIGYIVEVSNLGSIDGQVGIGNLSCGDNSAIMCQAMAIDEGQTNFFQFNNGNQDYSEISFPLKVGEKHYIMVMVGYDDVTEQPTDLDASIKLDLTYEQYKDPNAPIPSGETTLIGGQEIELVSGGDGLYKDEYEAGKYTYKGTNPNNYIEFNDETWRIISIDSNGLIKIMRNEIIGNTEFDFGNSNAWDTSDIKTYLNDTYLPTIKTNADKIVSHTWSIGAVTFINSDLAGQIADENGTQSQSASVGMITASEYLRANKNKTWCGNHSLNNDNTARCLTTNWMYNIVPSNGYLWTISHSTSDSRLFFYVCGFYGYDGYLLINKNEDYPGGVSPVVYLNSDITLSGTGSSYDPFIIM